MNAKREQRTQAVPSAVERDAFSKREATIVKGAALLMMMWHHCFLAGRFDKYEILFWPFSESQVVNIAAFFKICVSLFAFVSGYGLFLSYENRISTADRQHTVNKWIFYRLRKTMSGYWFIVLCAWCICMGIDQLPMRVYGFGKSGAYGLWRMLLDFLGLSHFFGESPLNATWWYMSAAIAFILATPLLHTSLRHLGWICTLGIIFAVPRLCGGYPGGVNFFSFLPAFCIGMAFAQNNVFGKWAHWWDKQFGKSRVLAPAKFCVMLAVLLLSYRLYARIPTDKYWDIKYGVLPLTVIFFVNDYISQIPVISRLLYFLGKHSMNVFLVHTFIRYNYCEKFTYGMKHFWLILVVLLAFSIGISVCIEYLKKAIHWERLVDKVGSLLRESEDL